MESGLRPVVVEPGGGEIVGDSPDRRVEVLSDHDSLHATWSRFGPHREGADLHVHHHHADHFYVLEGELTVRLGIEDRAVVAPAGTLVRVPPLVVHGFRNGSDSEVRYLNLHAPGSGFADFMRAIRDGRELAYDQHAPPPDGGRPSIDAVIGHNEVVVDRPDLRVALLADAESVAIADVWADAGAEPPAHSDRDHTRSFFVLEGELGFTSVGGRVIAGPGTWVQMPAGSSYTVDPPNEATVRFLDICSPGCRLAASLGTTA